MATSANTKCTSCSASIAKEDAFCSSCGQKVPDRNFNCANCDATTKIGDKHCRKCGHDLASPNRETEKKPQTIGSFYDDELSTNSSLGISPGIRQPIDKNSKVTWPKDEIPHSSKKKESSTVGIIAGFALIALVVAVLFSSTSDLFSGGSNADNSTKETSSEASYYKEDIAPHIVTGYAWSNFHSSSGINGGGSVSHFASQLFSYLDGISPVTRSGLESSMNPGNGLSNLLYAIIDDEGTVDLIYTWMWNHADN